MIASLNGTTTGGLAQESAEMLTRAGFNIGQKGNTEARGVPIPYVEFGPDAVVQAYTLRLYAPQAVLKFDETRKGAEVDLVLGKIDAELTADVGLDSSTPLKPMADCVQLATEG